MSEMLTEEQILELQIDQICKLIANGMVVDVDQYIAEEMGAFREDALSLEDAESSIFDDDFEFDEEEEI